MKMLLGCAAAMVVASVGACTPAAENPAKPEAAAEAPKVDAAAPTLAPVSLVGVWEGTIICYKMESPLKVTIDGAGPEKADVAMGANGALTWKATVTVDNATRVVTLKADTPNDQAAIISGALSADMASIEGKMDKQLCTDVKLTRKN